MYMYTLMGFKLCVDKIYLNEATEGYELFKIII